MHNQPISVSPKPANDGIIWRLSLLLRLRRDDSNRTSLWSGHLLPVQSFLQVSQQMTNVIGFKIRSSETIIICVCGADRFALLPFLAIVPPSTLQMLAANFTRAFSLKASSKLSRQAVPVIHLSQWNWFHDPCLEYLIYTKFLDQLTFSESESIMYPIPNKAGSWKKTSSALQKRFQLPGRRLCSASLSWM